MDGESERRESEISTKMQLVCTYISYDAFRLANLMSGGFYHSIPTDQLPVVCSNVSRQRAQLFFGEILSSDEAENDQECPIAVHSESERNMNDDVQMGRHNYDAMYTLLMCELI